MSLLSREALGNWPAERPATPSTLRQLADRSEQTQVGVGAKSKPKEPALSGAEGQDNFLSRFSRRDIFITTGNVVIPTKLPINPEITNKGQKGE